MPIRRNSKSLLTLASSFLLAFLLIACGGGGDNSGGGGGGGGTTPITVAVAPKRAGLTVSQTLAVSATVANDSASKGVNWTATGGSFSSTTSASGASVTYTAPTSPGSFTITATSVTDSSKSSSFTVGVTNFVGVTTYHVNAQRDGSNIREFALTPANVTSSTFGRLFSCTVDGAIYTQPLWVSNMVINGATHNVVFVATQHDSLYAFDADSNTSPCTPLWKANLVDANHGGTSGETPIPYSSGLVGNGFGDISPEIGVTGTPVIDTSSNLIYVVSKSVNASNQIVQRLHAITMTTGAEKSGSPVSITGTIGTTGNGDASINNSVFFDPATNNQRPGLALLNGVVYVTWASHEDRDPYHGWIIGFDKTSLAVHSVYCATPNGSRGGIWMSGGAPALDSASLYAITGNGTYDNLNSNYGDSFIKLSQTNLATQDWFTPSDEANRESADLDLGSGGAVILIDLPSAPHPHLLVGGGKRSAGNGVPGQFFVLDRDNLGHFTNDNSGAVQLVLLDKTIFATPAFWNDTLYFAPVGGSMLAYTLNTSTGQFSTAPSSQSSATFGFPGATPSISSNNTSSGIVWAIDSSQYCTPQSHGCGPAVLHAYDASNVATELWNSTQGTGNAAGYAVKFTVPTVANGKVYVGTRGNDTGTGTPTVPGELDVYGLLPN